MSGVIRYGRHRPHARRAILGSVGAKGSDFSFDLALFRTFPEKLPRPLRNCVPCRLKALALAGNILGLPMGREQRFPPSG